MEPGKSCSTTGVLKRESAERIPRAFDHYRARRLGTHPRNPQSKQQRAKYAVADRTPISFIGAWDTVGTLGIPVTFWGLLDNDEFLFHDTSPSRIVKTARHALSIDENREDFVPVMWDHKPGIDLKQVWFAGVHSDVGGGYADNHQLADITCTWLLREAGAVGLAVEPHLPKRLRPRPTAKQHDQRKGLYKLRGKTLRSIPADALIHTSVKDRFEQKRFGYRSPAFREFFSRAGKDWSRVHLEP